MRKFYASLLLLLCCHTSCTNHNPTQKNHTETKHLSNKNVADIPLIKELFGSLRMLLEKDLETYGKMPLTNEEQRQFAAAILPNLQAWVNEHLPDLQNAKKLLPLPDPSTLRYGRNLVLIVPEKGIYVFLHLLNPYQATPKHWHSQKGLSSLAFATMLDGGAYETKWYEENRITDPQSGEEFFELKKKYETPLNIGHLTVIPGDYGAHVVSNQTENRLAILEIYFEPEKMSEIDIPVPVHNSSTRHFADTISSTWLNELNLETTARIEKWPPISKEEALRIISKIPEAKVFTVVDHETVYVPKASTTALINKAKIVLKGPNNRFLLEE